MRAHALSLSPVHAGQPVAIQGSRPFDTRWLWGRAFAVHLAPCLLAVAMAVLAQPLSSIGGAAQPAEPSPPQVNYDEDTMLRSDLAGKLKSCREDEADLKRLQQTGIREEIARGPGWAKANLPRERLLEIKRYLEAEEQVRFRCGDVFAAVSVIRAEQEAKRLAALALARQRALEARRAEQLAKIEPPERKPEELRRTARSDVLPVRKPGVPPLPVRRIR